MHRASLPASALVLVACSLDPVGKADPDDVAGTTSTGTGVSSGSSSDAGVGAGGSALTAGSGGQGGAGSSQGGANPGGGGQGGEGGNQGGASQGGEGGSGGNGGSGDGGSGGEGGSGEGGSGGEGGGGDGGASQGGGGTGGAEPGCGNGVVEPPEECDGPEAECDGATCELRGACALDRHVSFQPGGLTLSADTEDPPMTTGFGTCAATDSTATHVYTYTTGPVDAYVEVVVDSDGVGLADPVLSFHPSCFDETISTCFTIGGPAPCCSNRPIFQDEQLLTDLMPAGTVFSVAVSGADSDVGHYDLRFRDYRYLFLEPFDPAPGLFTPDDASLALGPSTGTSCATGGTNACMKYGDVGDSTAGHSMTSASFQTPGVVTALLGWHHDIAQDLINPFDNYRVQVSIDGGFNWDTVYTHPQLINEVADKQVDASVIVGQEDVKIRFVVDAALGGTGTWSVDSVYVLAY